MKQQPKVVYNHSIQNIKALVRVSHLTKRAEDSDKFHNVYLFGIQSVTGKILTFHGMTDYGMLRSRIPLDQIFIKHPTNDIPFHFKQLWDCFSENVSVTTYEYLKEKKAQVSLRDGVKVWATYMFTVDWYDNSYSDEPSDYKCGHVLVADDGYLLCQPNNRIYWKDSNWITKEFPISPKQIKVDTELSSVENVSDRWVSEDTDSFYYDIKKIENDTRTKL
jgi:hypothetical protein